VTDPGRPPAADAPRHDPAVAEAATPVAPAPTAAPPVPVTATNGPLADVIAKPKASSGRGTSLLLVLAATIAVGGIAFAAGRLTAPAATASSGRPGNGQFPGGNLPGGAFPSGDLGFPGRGGGLGGVSLQGTVTAISADSITLELASGSTMTIPLDADTAFHASTAATAADVTVGSQVTVNPGTRVADPGASPDPNASPGPGTGLSFGPATDVTVTEP
jgi:hypothetical protein